MKLNNEKVSQKYSGENGTQHTENKFELVSCEQNGEKCKSHLSVINENYSEYDIYRQNREYQKSIEALNSAFRKTYELQDSTCVKCAQMFRSTIIQSLENIHAELHNMSTGLFRKKSYKTSYILAGNVLQNLKKEANRQ
ncbi:MAG: hypothetical protein JXR61_10300 [Prolixibacteraceae bacterium]|jgi:hypothetical protein|nr:hypothetical protein [Prolixibacteraceae bacterium]